jgi:hypothetical protein
MKQQPETNQPIPHDIPRGFRNIHEELKYQDQKQETQNG